MAGKRKGGTEGDYERRKSRNCRRPEAGKWQNASLLFITQSPKVSSQILAKILGRIGPKFGLLGKKIPSPPRPHPSNNGNFGGFVKKNFCSEHSQI